MHFTDAELDALLLQVANKRGMSADEYLRWAKTDNVKNLDQAFYFLVKVGRLSLNPPNQASTHDNP